MTKRKPRLHELLAVLPDTANTSQAISAETANTFTKKPDHFKGQTRTVSFFAESRAVENVSETKELVTTVHDKLAHTFAALTRHYDALLQQEEANCRAKADLIVDGQVIMSDVPATFLLGMEKRLKAIRDIIALAPTLEPSMKWVADATAGANIYRTVAAVSMRTEKQLNHKILVAATDKHPAQVEKWTDDVAVARIETTHVSGMLSPLDKSLILGRIDNLMGEVKQARQRANQAEVEDLHIGDKLFSYIMTGSLT